MSDKQPPTPVEPTGFSRKRTLKTFYEQQHHTVEHIVVKQEPKDDSNGVGVAQTSTTHLVPPPSPMALGSIRATPVRVSTIDMLDQVMAQSQQRPATPSLTATPRSSGTSTQPTAPMSAADRATQRSSIDERKFYADYYSQIQKWLALSHIARNFIATAVNAETAVDLARSDETKPPQSNHN